MDEAEHGVGDIVVDRQTLAAAAAGLETPSPAVAPDAERRARLDGAEQADEAVFDAIPLGDLASEQVFADRQGREVLEWPAELAGDGARSLPDGAGGILSALAEVLEQHAGTGKEEMRMPSTKEMARSVPRNTRRSKPDREPVTKSADLRMKACTCLRLANVEVGPLRNFHAAVLRDGTERLVL